MTLSIVASVCMGLSVLLAMVGLVGVRSHKSIRDRLGVYMNSSSSQPLSIQEVELGQPFSERVLLPLIKQTSRWFDWMIPQTRRNALRIRLAQAGNPGNMLPGDYSGLKGLCTCVTVSLAGGYLLLSHTKLDLTTLLTFGAISAIGFVAPDFWLSRQIKQRQAALVNTLPDAMDLLTITVEAGLSFDNGLQEIVAKWDNDLGNEFARVLRDVGMGQTRREALNALAERTGIPDLNSFVNALNQAEELGVSIGRVLRTQSEELRVRRRQRAQECANQAPIKMMFPLVFLIFPAIFAVLLGPAVPQLLETFGNLGG